MTTERRPRPAEGMTDEERYDPNRIGYWARVHDLDWEDVASEMPDLSDHVTGPDEQRAFQEGWEQADNELRTERMEALREDLEDC